MDQDKPFKTIEVVDNDTKQLCKVACMSCIRGHRTTSCGIPVCRSKIFWTVKRPGRPSNSCTCRFHSSGVCKCVTAIPKCPHKNKKGEKRTSECRCDEQGRFCCLLEPEHWQTLMALEKPIVQFYPSRDALEGWQPVQNGISSPPAQTPSFYEAAPPQRQGSCCGSSTSQSTPRMSRSIAPSPSDTTLSPQSSIVVPRFGLVGIDAPLGPGHETQDIMAWSGLPPSPLGDLQAEQDEQISSCCGGGSAYSPPSQDHQPQAYPDQFQQYVEAPATAFDFDRWNQNYQMYQYPNAICQHCGLNGCTCRSCPPLMQNFGTTSWAHSCGRRHARIAPMPVARAPQQVSPPQLQMQNSTMLPLEDPVLSTGILPPMQPGLAHPQSPNNLLQQIHASPPHIQQNVHPPYGQSQHLSPFIRHTQSPHLSTLPLLQPPSNAYNDHLLSTEPPDQLDYNEFILPFDRPQHMVDEPMYGS